MNRGAQTFALGFVPRWYAVAEDPRGGVFERLTLDAQPVDADEPKTTLVQARTLFALAHLALATGDAGLLATARRVHDYLDTHLRGEDGGYRFSTRDGLRRTYDQSFVLLALVTLARADPGAVPPGRIESCVRFIDERLSDPADGSLFEDEAMAARGPQPGELRAQNPHMHMLEAYLQAFEMTRDDAWLARASALVDLSRRVFFDPATGAVREFVGATLAPGEGEAGGRREPGHQYEWAWLLNRHADFGAGEHGRDDAERMLAFAQDHGLRADGPLAGAPFEALDASGQVRDDTHLLWPLTEAGKLHAALFERTGEPAHRDSALRLADIVFARFFRGNHEGPPVFVNRLGSEGETLWPEALSRLLYHVALFVTEGARAGLWTHSAPALGRCPETTDH